MRSYQEIRPQVVSAIRSAQLQVRWKPGSAARHLLKRKQRGHLPSSATLNDYEYVILQALKDARGRVYIYRYGNTPYVTVVSIVQERHWLVMLTLDAWIESAFVVEYPDRYLSQSSFEFVGLLGEVLA